MQGRKIKKKKAGSQKALLSFLIVFVCCLKLTHFLNQSQIQKKEKISILTNSICISIESLLHYKQQILKMG